MAIETTYDIDVASVTTFGISAKAGCLVRYDSVESLIDIIDAARLPRPLKVIGEGSNLLFTADFNGTLLLDARVDMTFEFMGNGVIEVTATAGTPLDRLIDECCRHNLWGLENLSGIPGTVGASAIQNVGAYGVEAADVIVSVNCLTVDDKSTISFSPDDLGYGYRTSMFKRNPGRYIVTEVTYRLTTCRNPQLGYANLNKYVDETNCTPDDLRQAVIAMRESKLPSPAFIGSAGSFFINPVVDKTCFDRICQSEQVIPPHFLVDEHRIKIPAAWLIDRCGLKGYRRGGAIVWEKQPLVIANIDNATADDVLAVEHEVISRVNNRFGITLTPEVEHIGTN